jgi:glutamate synthase domain-containing protein 3
MTIPTTTAVDCEGKTPRDINRAIREALAAGNAVAVTHTEARHNLGVALLSSGYVTFEGSVGYYCGGMNDGATIEIRGSAGWGVAEGMLSGEVIVHGSAGNSAAASIRGGTVVVRGDAGARAGVAMKGGLLVVEGNAAYMTGFMMQRGTIIICGNAGEALADSMYEGVILLGGEAASFGNDAVIEQPTDEDHRLIEQAFRTYGIERRPAFRRIVAGRKLWNFEKKELGVWKEAL